MITLNLGGGMIDAVKPANTSRVLEPVRQLLDVDAVVATRRLRAFLRKSHPSNAPTNLASQHLFPTTPGHEKLRSLQLAELRATLWRRCAMASDFGFG
ncbi:MAG: hypothetical protein EOO38_11105 [Cytophagaceae bacterium]|nr:MAG: hypothetical protein EOO38_11105 [Cytophagaceae bacterium]